MTRGGGGEGELNIYKLTLIQFEGYVVLFYWRQFLWRALKITVLGM